MIFQFKRFSVKHDQCAMKVGTDAVLLGSWVDFSNHPQNILDIGSGSGIIALMLAQRSDVMQIDAVEIDESAYEQCVENFENSDWSDRLFCYHASFQEFVAEMHEDEESYDLIVSNPPFFTTANEISTSREKARFNSALPFEDLVEGVDLLLSENGVFSIVLPFESESDFILLANQFQLYPFKITRVKGNPNIPFKRSLMAFSRKDNFDLFEDELVIELERHQYTVDFQNLVKDFYLKL